MEPYSMDLRSRVVNAYLAQEGSQADLAKRFQVSERWVQNLLRQQRETGAIEPLAHGGGRVRILGADKELLLLRVLAETPDASLDELRERCNVHGSRMCIARALERLNVTRKKSRFCAPSNKTRK
jgi:transposase